MKQKVILASISIVLVAAWLYATKGVRSAEVSTVHKQSKFLSVAELAAEESDNANAGTTTSLFSYQGQLLDSNGNPVAGSRSMIFRLYDALTGGTECWSETQNVTIDNGIFNVLLGANTPIDANGDCFAGDLYLELEIGGQTLSPRELLTSMNVPDGSRLGTAVVGQHLSFSNGLDFNIQPAAAIFGPDDGLLHLAADSTPLRTDGAWFRSGWIWISSLDSNAGNKGSVRIHIAEDTTLGNSPIFDVHRTQDDATSAQLLEVDRNGNTTVSGYLSAASQIRFGDEQILRWDGSRRLHLVPWGGAGRLFDEVCIGCGAPADLRVQGNMHIAGTCNVASSPDGTIIPTTNSEPCNTNGGQLTANSITTGAIVEANLPLPQEHSQLFSEGDVLCISAETYELELCSAANNRLVQAVANANGQAIVMGAEPIKVIGEVQVGDILVTSHIPGHAMVNNNPIPGTVIGQALEDFNGKSGLIQAMIRKW